MTQQNEGGHAQSLAPVPAVTRLQITIDCHDPGPLVSFWALALDYEPRPAPPGFATWREWYVSVGVPEDELGEGDCLDRLQDPKGVGPSIWFQPVPEQKSVKNRVHLDVYVTRGRDQPIEERAPLVDAKVAQLVAAGATRLPLIADTEGQYAVTLQDPEGNEFCIS
jgi:hypothetical protein